MKTTITCEQCGSETTCHTDYIGVRNADGEHLGHIYSADPAEDWDKITHGACPVCNGWEDGNGRTCTADGWSSVTREGGK